MRLLLMSLLCVLAAFSGPGCASIVHGSTTKIPLSSNPPGARVQIAGGKMGVMNVTTPTTVTLDNSYDYALRFTADGYQVEQVQITRVLRGMFWGNILFGGIIGGAVDAGTGAMWRLAPESITVTLAPLNPGESQRQVSTQPLTLEERRAMMDRLRATNQITEQEYQASIKAIDNERRKPGQAPN